MNELDDFVAEETEVETNAEIASESQPDEVQTEVEQAESTPEETVVNEGEPTSPEPQTETQPEPEPDAQVMIPLAAKQAEKERRIRAEQELAELRQQIESKPEPDAYVEPDKYVQHEIGKLKQEMQFERNMQSEKRAREKYDDFDVKMEAFAEMAKTQPHLVQQMTQDFDPGEFVYKTAKAHLDLQEIGDIDTYKENLRSELKAEILAEMKAEQPAPKSPPDLSTVRSTGGDPVTEIADGTDGLEQLLGR